MKKNYKELVNDVRDSFVKGLKDDGLKWFSNWKPKYQSINGKSNAHYNGINHLRLSFDGFADTRYYTFNQVQEMGLKVIKGSKSQPVVKFGYKVVEVDGNNSQTENKKDGESQEVEVPYFKYYNVFNAEQIEGLELQPQAQSQVDTRLLETIAKNIKVKLVWGSTYENPCYIPNEDTVYMPSKSLFKDKNGLYATALHELAHATGHKSRLDRNIMNTFKSKDYAYEELVAEMTSALLCSYLGIENIVNDNHKAYVKSWLKILKDNPKHLIDAFKLAEKSTDYIINSTKLEMNELAETEKVEAPTEKVEAPKTTEKAVKTTKKVAKIKARKTTKKAPKKATNKTKKATDTIMKSFVKDSIEYVSFSIKDEDNFTRAYCEMPLSFYMNMKKKEKRQFEKAWGIA